MLFQHDGFDHYGTAALNTANSQQLASWNSGGYITPTGAIAPSTSYGRITGSYGLGLPVATTDNVWVKKPIVPEKFLNDPTWTPNNIVDRLILGFAIRFPIALTGNLQFVKMGGIQVSIGTDWFIYVDGVQTQYQCELNIWNFPELEFDLVNQKFRLWMNDNRVLEKNFTSPKTVFDYWELRAQLLTGSGSTIQAHIDDVYLLDGSGDVNNDRIGKCNTLTRFPTADATVAMTPNSGTNNFSRVNQQAPDGDATYVSSNKPLTTDLYTNPTVFETVDDAAVRAVTIVPCARMVEPDSLSVTAYIDSAGTVAEGHRMKLRAASYTSEKHIFEKNPKTNAPWAPTEVVALKFGQKILARQTT